MNFLGEVPWRTFVQVAFNIRILMSKANCCRRSETVECSLSCVYILWWRREANNAERNRGVHRLHYTYWRKGRSRWLHFATVLNARFTSATFCSFSPRAWLSFTKLCCWSRFWVMAPCRCRLCCRRFGEPHCLYVFRLESGDSLELGIGFFC